VERFDLKADGGYLGIEDFCVLDGRRAHGRYDGSYEQIARRIGDFVSTGALRDALEQFALAVAYSCAIENGDAHRKNFSVLYEHPESAVRFAPVYDLVSTTPYIPRDTLALTINGTKQFPSREGLVRFIRMVTSKSEHGAVELLDRVALGVGVAIKEAGKYGKKYPDARGFIERLVGVMRRGLRRLTG
jgi:serine/threonine-protein kinase HipA